MRYIEGVFLTMGRAERLRWLRNHAVELPAAMQRGGTASVPPYRVNVNASINAPGVRDPPSER
jgi:hypothetical protein